MKEDRVSLVELEEEMSRTRASLSAYIYRMVIHRETAEEIFQETWLRVVRNLGSFDNSMPFSPWLFRIARNLCLNHLKREKRKKEKKHLLHAAGDQEQASILPHEAEKMKGCLDRLPVKFREILHLRFFEEKSGRETAELLGIPLGTVESRTHRGLKHLRKIWDK